LCIIQRPFSVAPCQTLISRFATFAWLYHPRRRLRLPLARPLALQLQLAHGGGQRPPFAQQLHALRPQRTGVRLRRLQPRVQLAPLARAPAAPFLSVRRIAGGKGIRRRGGRE
jgi:hypothetical protein